MAIVEPLNRGEYNTLSASYSMLALGAYTRHFKGAENDDLIKINSVDIGGKKHVLKTNVGAFAKANFPVSSETIEFHAGQNLLLGRLSHLQQLVVKLKLEFGYAP